MMDVFGFTLDTSHSQLWFDETCATGLGIGGTFYYDRYDKDGNYLNSGTAKNIIPNAVLNDVLNVYFAQSANTPAFYTGMVDNNAFSAFAATDTMSSHAGWVENTATSNGSRPQWTPGAASNVSIVNPVQVTITMNAVATIKGFFLTSNNTLGGTSGNLVATAPITSGPQGCNPGDVLKVSYAINGFTS